jgi:hypothetical protein
MANQPGFIPVNFQLTGKILLAVGSITLLICGIAAITEWFRVPVLTPYFGIAAIIAGAYMLIVVPNPDREDN